MWGTGEDDWYPRQLCVPKGRLESNTVLYIMTHVYPPDPHNLLSNCYTSDKFILCAAHLFFFFFFFKKSIFVPLGLTNPM